MPRRFKVPHIASSEITSETAYFNRRELMKAAGLAALPAAIAGSSTAAAAVKPLEYR